MQSLCLTRQAESFIFEESFFMSNDVFEKVKQLPPEKQQEVEDFVDFLLSKHPPANGMTPEEIGEMRRRNAGRLKGQIWMADDFNETPEDFKDYL